MPPTMTTAQRTAALQLCVCLQSAPPLETVQKLEDKLPKYKGVPSTPAPPETSEESPAFCNAENVVRDHADDCGPLRERGGSQLAASSSLLVGPRRTGCSSRPREWRPVPIVRRLGSRLSDFPRPLSTLGAAVVQLFFSFLEIQILGAFALGVSVWGG